ncbi:signal peptidase I [Pelagirhabdus alkalitolerans]|uniref:Signal peptidase I n=1 Tax=Pelagirhabdus alkalitolerans TaxID=1612202 RepID=A0A1G6LMY9_9BACI|nr:signal peptidase I [Pelagirhabdus alkalitolerans]SDC44610.1 signal peptidase I [Pelagirhabdus alkalitolerans]
MKDSVNYWHLLKVMSTVLILVLLMKVYVFSSFLVEGHSMEATLYDGNMILVNEMIYHYQDIDRFDVIVFKQNDEYYVKRIVGLPGDQVGYQEGALYVNGSRIDEPYLYSTYDAQYVLDFTLQDLTSEQVVPSHHVFVLGDNRTRSLDSRQLGFIPKHDIVGKVEYRYWPFSLFEFQIRH